MTPMQVEHLFELSLRLQEGPGLDFRLFIKSSAIISGTINVRSLEGQGNSDHGRITSQQSDGRSQESGARFMKHCPRIT